MAGPRGRSRSRSRGRSQSRGRTRSRSQSRGPRGRTPSRSRSRRPARGPGKKRVLFVRRARSRSRSRSRGGVDNRRNVGNQVVSLLGRRPWSSVSGVSGVDYRATRRNFALEGSPTDVDAGIGTEEFRFAATEAAVLAKIKELGAKDVTQGVCSLYLDFLGTQQQCYGFIYVLLAPYGAETKSSDNIVADPETRKYEWAKCPGRINIRAPPVKPWETHIPAINNQNRYALHVCTALKRKDKNLISDSDIVLTLKGEFVYEGEFKKV